MKIAINGFGRIGRQFFKAGFGTRGFDVVAINDLSDVETLAYLLKYDSNYGIWGVDVRAGKGALIVNGKTIPVYCEREPAKLPWAKVGAQTVVECTGFFREKKTAEGHLTAGAKRVIISAPPKGDDVPTVVFGVNDGALKTAKGVISNASCTTNCVAPVTAVIEEVFGIKRAMLSTIHAYTSTQAIVDGPDAKDVRRGRAGAINIVPTTTGASEAVGATIPSMKGKFEGISLRVPIPVGSISDITYVLKKKATAQEINYALESASKTARYDGILTVTYEPIVSTDIIGDPHSAIVDANLTRAVGDLVKVVAWYDNEWAYSTRLVEMALMFK